MKAFREVVFDPLEFKADLDEFAELLASKPDLAERADLMPFFRDQAQFASLLGTFVTDVRARDRIAEEFPIVGDFAADLVVGSASRSACPA